jgi:hypothetical protein
MSMGNYFSVLSVGKVVMAASKQPLGVDHTTIVPENFEPDAAGSESDEPISDSE